LDIIGEGGMPRQADVRQLSFLAGHWGREAEVWEYPTSRSAAAALRTTF
jgi:hypothetical protein